MRSANHRPCFTRAGLRRAAGLALVAGALALLRLAAAAPAVLYDGSAGGTPDTQGMLYQASGEQLGTPPLAASQRFAGGLTILKTSDELGDSAGYGARPGRTPALDRSRPFTLTFTVQIVAQANTSPDRAGFSVLVVASDLRAIELGFWEDRVWAQGDAPLFERAEEATLDTTRLISYTLAVDGDGYTLSGGGARLSGPLRDYRAATFPAYRIPNLIFLGDNTTRASVELRLAAVAIEVAAPPPSPSPTPTPSSTLIPTASATPTPTPSSTPALTASATSLPLPSSMPTRTPTAPATRTPTRTAAPPATQTAGPAASPTATPTTDLGAGPGHRLYLPLLGSAPPSARLSRVTLV